MTKQKQTVDLAAMSCKALVRAIIQARGSQSAAVLATKLNARLAALGKERVTKTRAVRGGFGGTGAAL
jgi:hypothetical protein